MVDIVKIILSIPELFSAEGSCVDEIYLAEKALALKFAEDYKQYVEEFGIIAYEGHELTGITECTQLNVVDITKEEKRKNKSIPDNFYVIEVANIDGVVVWQKDTGEIYKTVYNSSPILICKSLGDYIQL